MEHRDVERLAGSDCHLCDDEFVRDRIFIPDLLAAAYNARPWRLRLHREQPALALSDLQPEGTRARGLAACDAWLFLWTSRPFLEQLPAFTDALSFA